MATTKKSSGIGAVYSSTTGTVVTVFNSVNTLASAGRMLAQNAEVQAMISRVESSNALLETMGVDTEKLEAVDRISSAAQLMSALRDM
jgi:hypothetical protein